ncbi:uncharacterized protein LOC118195354 [Stegodyphus dumicola]|uniref:uncharacterized protein LOC118195354 n=1 Tax=Stegodyphus dumicola TaxID=202533 RepID=UPI0015AEE42D|nr:uncharacterized protein LOC118195354 [Stegodyphus dumicola]
MWLLSLLFVYGFLPFFSCEECIKKLVECSNLRVEVQMAQYLPAADEGLEKLCGVQGQYIECLFNVSQICDEELSATIKLTFMNNEDFIKQFCKRGSDWWKSFMKSSRCINQQNFKSCVTADNAGILKEKFEMRRRCSVLNHLMACGATMILEKCGFEAENLFLSLAVFVSDYHFKCSLVGEIKDSKTEGASKKPPPEAKEKLNKLDSNLRLKRAVEYPEPEGTVHINYTEVLRRIGKNLHDAAHRSSVFPAFLMQDEIQVHSSVQEPENAKFHGESTEIPLVTPVTFAAELHNAVQEELNEETDARSDVGTEIPLFTSETLITKPHEATQEEYLNEGSGEDIYLDDIEDTESSILEYTGSVTGSHHIKYLENLRYHGDEPKEFITDLSKNFAARAISIIRKIFDPNLKIEAFKYPDGTVRVYWEHPFKAPFQTLVCRPADYIERYFAKSFTCIVYL